MTIANKVARNVATLAMGGVVLAATAFVAHAEPKSAEQAKKDCDAKGSFYTLSAPHKAGDINAKTGQPYKRDSGGICRFNVTKAKEALAGK